MEACKRELARGQSAKNIALIYRYGGRSYASRLEATLRRWDQQIQQEKLYWVNKDFHNKTNYGVNQPGARLITTQSALGLEFKSAYLLWLEDFDRALQGGNAEQQIRDLRELYVAMTRAQDQLTLICSSTSCLGAHLALEKEALGLEVIHA